MGPRLVRQAGLLYGALVVAGALWIGLRGRELSVLSDSPLVGVLLGISGAALTFSLGLLAYRALPVMRRISDELAPVVVDGSRRGDLILLSVFSGIGEEVFFRGAMQPELGLVLTSVIFGAVHIGPDRRYLVWTVWAVLAGFLLGGLFAVTGGLLAPVIAHTIHNAATLLLWKRSRQRAAKAP